jgi:hypothetical protein
MVLRQTRTIFRLEAADGWERLISIRSERHSAVRKIDRLPDVTPPFAGLSPMAMHGPERDERARRSAAEAKSLLGLKTPRRSFSDLIATETHILGVKSHPVLEWRTLAGELLWAYDETMGGLSGAAAGRRRVSGLYE